MLAAGKFGLRDSVHAHIYQTTRLVTKKTFKNNFLEKHRSPPMVNAWYRG